MKMSKSISFLISVAMAAVSGILAVLSMPGYDIPYLAWVAFVPLLLAASRNTGFRRYILFNVTGLLWSVGCHMWFPDVLGKGLGIFLMVMSGLLYGFFLQLGFDMQERYRRKMNLIGLLAFPIIWTALEWLRFVMPVTREWWIEVIAKSQWTVPGHLQILSVTGFPGLSFLIMLANMALAAIVMKLWSERRLDKLALSLLVLPLAVLTWGNMIVGVQGHTSDTITVAANADLVNQDPKVTSLGGGLTAGDGYLADTPEMSQAIFDVNKALSIEAAESAKPAFIVWGENEFTSYDNIEMIGQLKELAVETRAYITADIVWNSDDGMHDTALLVGPDGNEVGKSAKVNLTSGEKEYGFVAGREFGNVFDTPYGKVGLAVCWDRHTTNVVRALSRGGARLLLIPVDDDFNGNKLFPYYAASDTVFRAVENRVAIVTGSTSGMSQVITPYGNMAAISGINSREWISGDIYMVDEPTIYSRWGDWFGIVMAACFVLLVALSGRVKKKR